MANGSEKAQKVAGDVLHRLRNDHEQFLEAYEKPTQIYRFLRSRQILKPMFLQRNLSYMRQGGKHRKNRFRKKLKVDDLLSHTKDIKPDLASEIKSDNHLKISFSGLEQGYSLQGLLDGPDPRVPTAECEVDHKFLGRPEHGQTMELELLLLKFKQPSMDLSEGSHPYSCLSLGKQLLKYKATNPTSSSSSSSNPSEDLADIDTSSQSESGQLEEPNEEEEKDLTLTIPESMLTWRGDHSSPGTRMLVFRVTSCVKRPSSAASKPKRKPVQLINFVSRKGCRKNVAVEVNRLNLADIEQAKAKSKGQPDLGPGSGEGGKGSDVRNGWSEMNGVDACNGTGDLESECVAGLENGGVGRLVSSNSNSGEADSRDGTGTRIRGRAGGVVSSELLISDDVSMNTPTDTCEGRGNKGTLSKHGPLTKKSKSKLNKKARSDASVMTEISLGTGIIKDMRSVSPLSGSPTHDHAASSFASPPPQNDHAPLANNHAHSSLPPLPKKGYVNKSTSPRMLFRNGSFNGVMNGYALPEVAAALKARSLQQSDSKNHVESKVPEKEVTEKTDDAVSKEKTDRVVKVNRVTPKKPLKQIVATLKRKRKRLAKNSSAKKFKRVLRQPVGTGKRGTRSFLVSLPRVHYDDHFGSESGRVGTRTGAKRGAHDSTPPPPPPPSRITASEGGARGGVGGGSGGGGGGKTISTSSGNAATTTTYRRRSEIQLLLDGDKPRGQRLSETDIPVFVAEDISNRSTCNSASSNLIWLESSTRKITPVEHFAYPIPSLSPTRRAPGASGEVHSAGSSPTMLHLPGGGTGVGGGGGNHRKRVSNNTELVISPPTKHLRVTSTHSNPADTSRRKEKERSNVRRAEEAVTEEGAMEIKEEEEGGRNDQALDASTQAVAAPPTQSLASLPSAAQKLVATAVERDTPPTMVTTTMTYSGELAVFDSRGECLVKDGQYSILMQSCSSSSSFADSSSTGGKPGPQQGLSTFEPLTWATVFGGGEKVSQGVECPNLLLKFSVHWLDGPPQHRFCSELSTALDIKKIRESYFPPLPPAPLTRDSTPSPSILSPSNYLPRPRSPSPTSTSAAAVAAPMEIPGEEVKIEPEANKREGNGQAVLPADDPFFSPERVFFNFLYSNNTLQQTEAREGLVCPWCGLSCKRIYSLLKHMSLCHPRFQFTYTPNTDGKCVINVHVNKMYTGSSSFDRDPGERSHVSLVQKRKGPSKCLSCSAVLVERHTELKEDLSEFLNDGSWKRGYNTNRIYYHSRTALPMLPKELEEESKEEQQTREWQDSSSQKMIDEFTDVNSGEKEFMKMWNNFTLENKVIADKQVPIACIKFARQKGSLLRAKGLVPNYMSHLINLFDFGLVAPSILKEGMIAVLADD